MFALRLTTRTPQYRQQYHSVTAPRWWNTGKSFLCLVYGPFLVTGASRPFPRFLPLSFESCVVQPATTFRVHLGQIVICCWAQVDEDIFTELPIRTQTGPLSIPVVCTARRVQPSLSTNLVVFRRTVIGEREVRSPRSGTIVCPLQARGHTSCRRYQCLPFTSLDNNA